MLWRRRCVVAIVAQHKAVPGDPRDGDLDTEFFSSGREEERKQVAAPRLVITSEVSGLDGAYHAAERRPERHSVSWKPESHSTLAITRPHSP